MRLHDAAKYFDREAIFDGYLGTLLFKGQTGDFDDSTSIGATLRRRTLSLAPELSVPLRRCVRIGPLYWLAGLGILDSFQGQDIRNTYNLRLATNLFSIATPGSVFTPPTVPHEAYGYAEFFKSTSSTRDESDYDTFWNVFFAPIEAVTKGMYLRTGDRCLRVRQVYEAPEKLTIAQADELDPGWSQTVTFTGLGAYDPVEDEYEQIQTTTQAIYFDITKLYRFDVQAEAEIKPGDKALVVPTTVVPKVGTQLTLLSRQWRIMTVQMEADAWLLHIRPL